MGDRFGVDLRMLVRGCRLGNFEIVAPLRAGGMASLYVARRRGAAGFDRPVAVKLIHPHLAGDRELVEMFLDEARLAARIQDPHVVHVEELGEAEGTYFIVMEYVHGRSLSELMTELRKQGRRMSTECATYIAMQIARGLQAAHEAVGDDGRSLGVVHRDVSPQNVLISFRGHVKLIDFGIAKAHGRARHTEADALRGKLAYMSPEQALACDVIDARADVYALGIVLWEMLTSERLFSSHNCLALLDQVRAPSIPRPSTRVPGIPKELDDVVMAALTPEADERLPSAREMLRRLADALPAARNIDDADLAALLAAVAPDDTPAAVSVVTPGVEISVEKTRTALDTLSVVSGEMNAPRTRSTVVALEAARDDAARWRRRAATIATFAILAALLLGTSSAVLAFGQRTAVVDAPPDIAPVSANVVAPVATTVAASPPTASSIASEAPTPPSKPAVKARTKAAATAPAKPAPSRSARSIEVIDGVPMVRGEE